MSRHLSKLTLLIVLVAFLLPHWESWLTLPTAFAQNEPPIPAGVDSTIATYVTRALTFVNLTTWILFAFLNYLLDPAFIFNLDPTTGADGGLMNMLNRIWQVSRDLVNIAFAVALIGGAVYTIVTSNTQFLNEHSKKFIMAVVLVNFSWFIPRVVLDISNVLAATIYNVPSIISPDGEIQCTYKSNKFKQNYCEGAAAPYLCKCAMVKDVRFLLDRRDPNDAKILDPSSGYTCPLGELLCYQEVPMTSTTKVAGYSAVLNGLVLNHARLSSLAAVPDPLGGANMEVKQLMVFIVREMMILLLSVALFFPLLAMTVAFVIRIPILWVTIAFMPFYFLSFVGGEKFGGDEAKKVMDYFIKAAFLPAMVAVPLAIGFIMINAGATLVSPLNNLPIKMFDEIGDFGQLLWLMLSLGVLWIGVFEALKKGPDIVNKYTDTIKGTGQTFGRIAAKLPLSIAPIPGVKLGGQSLTPYALSQRLRPSAIENALKTDGGLKEFFTQGPEKAERKGAVDKLKVDGTFRINLQNAIVNNNPAELKNALLAAGFSADSLKGAKLGENLEKIQAELKKQGVGLEKVVGNPTTPPAVDQAKVDTAIRNAKQNR